MKFKDLSVEEAFDILNNMNEHIIDTEVEGDEIIYITVDLLMAARIFYRTSWEGKCLGVY